MLTDAFIYRLASIDSFLVDVSRQNLQGLYDHLKRYKIRNQVEITDQSSLYSANHVFSESSLKIDDESAIILKDPRDSKLGTRYIIPNSSDIFESGAYQMKYDYYTYRRFQSLVPEVFLPNVSLPLECGLQSMNGGKFD